MGYYLRGLSLMKIKGFDYFFMMKIKGVDYFSLRLFWLYD